MNEKNREKELFLNILGKHIRKRRIQMGLTLEQLSEETDIDDKHLGKLERGEKEARAYTLAIIQTILELNSDDYLNEFLHKKTKK